MKAQNMPRADFVMSIFLTAFGIAVTILSLMMPRLESQNVSPYSVPGLVPGFLGVVIAFLGLTMLIRSIRAGGYSLGITKNGIEAFLRGEESQRILLTVSLCVVYAMGLLGRVHFLLATAIFIFGFVLVFEYKRNVGFRAQWKVVFFGVILSLVASASVYAVFAYLFLVNLP